MTLELALSLAERARPGIMSQAEMIFVISSLDKRVKAQVLDLHEGSHAEGFSGYTSITPGQTELLIPDSYAEIYIRRIEAECDYKSGEIERYNNSATLFNELWESFVSYWKLTHRPLGAKGWKLPTSSL